jgi:hypothetical protein
LTSHSEAFLQVARHTIFYGGGGGWCSQPLTQTKPGNEDLRDCKALTESGPNTRQALSRSGPLVRLYP